MVTFGYLEAKTLVALDDRQSISALTEYVERDLMECLIIHHNQIANAVAQASWVINDFMRKKCLQHRMFFHRKISFL